MQITQKLILALIIQATFLTTTNASEQSESKGFIEDAEGSVLFRTGYVTRDRDPSADLSSAGQAAIVELKSGFTKGTIGFGLDIIGDAGFKLGENAHNGNGMLVKRDDGSAYDHWMRGGGVVKARFSNTTVTYGTHVLDIPVLASNTARIVPEYFTGFLVKSHEIKDLELVAGKFTKDQYSDRLSSDGNHLDRAVIWGAVYKFNDRMNGSYYGLDEQDLIDRHYINLNYTQPLADDSSINYDFSGYYTKFSKNASTYSATGYVQPGYNISGNANEGFAGVEKSNSIWSLSADYKKGPHSVLLGYQQNTGNVGYDYGGNADGYQSIYVSNSYLSDFVGNHEKSLQLRYNYNFKNWSLPGLTWTSAFVYGWDIDVLNSDKEGKEHEFFNQVKYTVQDGFAKGASLRLRNSMLRANAAYTPVYMGNVNEWRIFLDIPVKLF
ncbi:OprD family porin [Acinetobacter sp. 194]|uniref:OprD family outer membrane porin n=1 Tax=Acinetobacter shaoyimingii TaxID=2715164 RepID=UPI00140D8714|nr:OprD family outer membrane porin [Acinetobacter shaoyimingii]NHB59216.1 OprD family porin [Acinetobacter shaoyimingii]